MIEMNNNSEKQPASNEERPRLSRSRTFALTLRRRKLGIVVITALCVIAAIVYISKAIPTYTSSSRIYVEQTGPRIITEYEGVMTQSKNYLYTQGELITSTPILVQVAQRSDIKTLQTLKENPESLIEKITRRIGLATPAVPMSETETLLMYLKKLIDVDIGIRDDIITVSCESKYREEAAQIVNAVIESYVDYQTNQKKSSVLEMLKILEKEKVDRDKELADNFQELLDFTRQYGIVSLDKSGGDAPYQRFRNLAESLTAIQLAVTNAKAQYEAVQNMADDPLKIKQFAIAQPGNGAGIFDSENEKELQANLIELKTELGNAVLECSADHPTVKALQSKITEIEKQLSEQLAAEAKAYIEALNVQYQTLKQREDELEVSFDQEKEVVRNLNIKATEYTIIETKLEESKRFCEVLDDRIKELNVSQDTGGLNIIVLEVARPADIATSPQMAKIVAASLVLGLLLGIGFAILREKMDWKLRGTEEISAILDVPVLGVVPSMDGRTKKELTAYGQKVHLEPKSSAAEAYKTIRTAVFFGVPKGQARTILITSPSVSDGKTTMVSNLAIAIAQAGQKTLIVDADFRKPMQHKIFGFDDGSQKGLSSILAGEVSIDDAIRKCPTDGLELLASGPEVPNPSELLNSEAFANLLKELTHRYDRIVIDSPPITPVADSQILAAICDITILVVRAEKSTKKASLHAREALVGVGAHVLGAIVNDVSPRHSRYDYYSHYGYYGYGYGYGNKTK